jgi:tricorn protease
MIRLRAAFELVLLTVFVATPAAFGQEPISFARHPDISPDGKLVAFSYLGDIWVVESIGGTARPITNHLAHDAYPIFSPDGKHIAFSSNRFGNYDVFVVPVQGGRPRRLTFDSAPDIVTGWAPDGKSLLFASTRGNDYPTTFDLYSVPFEGGREKRITVSEGREGVFSPRGDRIAYVRGPGTWYRKGYVGSSNDEIWICNADGSNNFQLTNNDRQDNSPMWAGDGQSLYYVSEIFGTPANIVKQGADGKTKPQLVTFHKEDGVRRARISANGQWIVYECGFDIWVTATCEGCTPRKLAIEVHADDKTNAEEETTFTRGITEFALTADDTFAAFVLHGQIWGMALPSESKPAGKPVRLTHSAAYDNGMSFSPDGTKMTFLSDRNGYENIYLLEPDEPGKKIAQATRFKVKQITDSREAHLGASFSPDGKRIAYLRSGKLFTMNPDGSDPKEIVGTQQVIDYEWSPDSRWIAFARMDGSFASEIYIIAAAGGEAKNVTRFATFNAGISWSRDGMKLAFLSDRRQGAVAFYVMALQKPAAPGVAGNAEIDWEDIHLRTEIAAPLPAEQGAISQDGKMVAFRSVSVGQDDLWIASVDGERKNFSRLTTGNMRPQQIQWSRKRFSPAVYFLDGDGVIRMTSVPSLTGGSAVPLPFKVKMTIRQEEEFTEMFDQSWRALSDHFYDPKYHGVDWSALRNKYRPMIKHCAMKEDLLALISLLMGELNASHLGIGPAINTYRAPQTSTADLGLIFDDGYAGPGLRIAEVLKRGPADKRGLNLRTGDVIVSLDGSELDARSNISELLNGKLDDHGKPEEAVQLLVAPVGADPNDRKLWRKVDLMPANRQDIRNLMYDRWVDQNAARVNELTKGKLGYIHIASMDEHGLDRFLRSLYSDNQEKEGIVLDVRFNGGGFTHDQVLNYLGGKEHTLFRQRDGGEGWVLRRDDRKWSKPVILLINNRSFSDAEIFPNAFRTLGMGKLVGEPTGGFVIGTTSVRLIDGSVFRTPRTGVYTIKGVNMEKAGVVPDVIVANHPDQLARGIDAQLDRAVELLQGDVVEWKKKKNATLSAQAEGSGSPGTKGSTIVPVPVPPPAKQ